MVNSEKITDNTMVNNDKNHRQHNFVVNYHCFVCHFCRYLPLCCLSFLSLFNIVLSVIFVVIYHCVVCDFVVIYHCAVCDFCRNDRQHNGK
jgi:flagellar biosynthesis component FlhA